MAFTLTPDLLGAQARGESGGNTNIGQHYASNDPLGRSAGGMFGFTNGTWSGLMNKYPNLGLTMAGKNDPAQQQRAYPVFAADNAKALASAGAPVNASTVSLASFLGPAAASAFAKAPPGANALDTVAQALGPEKARLFSASNPTILTPGATVGDVISHNDRTHVNSNGRDLGQAPMSTPASPGGMPTAAPPPPMPDDFARGPQDPSRVAQVDTSGHDGDGLIATGLAMMSGRDWRDSMGKAGEAYSAAADRAKAIQLRNAELENDAIKRDTDAPYRAAQVAEARASAWNTLNAPTTLTAAQQATLQQSQNELDVRRQQNAEILAMDRARLQQSDDQFRQTQELRSRQFDEGAKQSQQFIVPGDQPGLEQNVQVTQNRNGAVEVRNLSTGEVLPTLPPGAIPQGTYNSQQQQAARLSGKADTAAASILTDAQAADSRVAEINRAIEAGNRPDANLGPDAGSRIARAVFPLLGIESSDQDMAKMTLAGVSNSIASAALKGQGAVSDSERKLMAALSPQVETSAAARNQMLTIVRDIAARPAMVGKLWMDASPADKQAARASQTALAEWKYGATQKVIAAQEAARQSTPAAGQAPTASTFWKRPQAATGQSAQGTPAAPQAQAAPPIYND